MPAIKFYNSWGSLTVMVDLRLVKELLNFDYEADLCWEIFYVASFLAYDVMVWIVLFAKL